MVTTFRMITTGLYHSYLWVSSVLRWWWRYGLAITWLCTVFVFVIPRSTVLVYDTNQAIAIDISTIHFDYIGWEVSAIRAKAAQMLFGQHAFMDEESRSQFVRDYMADIAHAQQLEGQVNSIYTEPNTENPASVAAALIQERDSLREVLSRRQATAEAILEGQVANILAEEGFAFMGQVLPPMAMRFTRMPNLLVTSPRDAIRMEVSIAVDPLSVDQRTTIENALDAEHDVSSIIVPLGGIALYPAMINETASIPFAIETFAHEWLHHYLYFHPLGVSYFTGDGFAGEARIINETTADLFGKEIARLVLQRYYPEEPLPQLPTYQANPTTTQADSSNGFDLAAEMHETRTTLDELLASVAVESAEIYLEERRQFFFDNGYRFRKLNQAFFAFYGGYQAGGGVSGAGGQDPTGSTILAIRSQTSSIHAFVATLQDVTSLDELLSLQVSLEADD
ncbi:MAG: hypothetical protein Q9P44_04840 [Anaerolineae bacterium]|nr:hypothetical protein [Anaerolineae bacterium]